MAAVAELGSLRRVSRDSIHHRFCRCLFSCSLRFAPTHRLGLVGRLGGFLSHGWRLMARTLTLLSIMQRLCQPGLLRLFTSAVEQYSGFRRQSGGAVAAVTLVAGPSPRQRGSTMDHETPNHARECVKTRVQSFSRTKTGSNHPRRKEKCVISEIAFSHRKVGTDTLEWSLQIPQRGRMRYTITRNEKDEWFEVGETSQEDQTWRKFFEMTLRKK
jgi:hypothetical protein